jgi:hypothetical protein
MNERSPRFAGRFYPGRPQELTRTLAECFVNRPATRPGSLALVAPHAGYLYSGKIAALGWASLAPSQRYTILAPNHTGAGQGPAALTLRDWSTPLGIFPTDRQATEGLAQRSQLWRVDEEAHRNEHAIEVHIPLLQYSHPPGGALVAAVISACQYSEILKLGEDLADWWREYPETRMIASTDFNHFEDEPTTRRKDRAALEAILECDPEKLWRTVSQKRISMCGLAPVAVLLHALSRLGQPWCEKVAEGNSAAISGDFQRVVGYASLLLGLEPKREKLSPEAATETGIAN